MPLKRFHKKVRFLWLLYILKTYLSSPENFKINLGQYIDFKVWVCPPGGMWRKPKSEQNRIQTVCSEMSHSAPQGEKEDSKEGSIGDDKSEKESRDKSDKDDKKKKKKVET